MFPIKIKSIIKDELPGNQDKKENWKDIFQILPWVIIKWENLEINQKEEKVKDNYFNIGKKEGFFLGVPVDLIGPERINQDKPYEIDKQVKRQLLPGKTIISRKKITKPSYKEKV
jgi:hypothetical protein